MVYILIISFGRHSSKKQVFVDVSDNLILPQYLKYHPDLVCNLNEASFESKVLWKGDNGSVKSAEAVFIRSMKPEINIMLNTPA